MTKSKMYMAETCVGYIEKRLRKKRWGMKRAVGILRELSLLLLVALLLLLWRADAGKGGNYILPAVPDTVSGFSQEEEPPIPWNWSLQTDSLDPDSCFLEEEEPSYYAGPFGKLRKEPEEILVVLDPGHGGKDDGCARGKVREKDVNLAIALEVQKRLETLGYQVLMTRDTDQALSLGERVRVAEEAQADIYVSIHQNSSELSTRFTISLWS